MKGGGPAGARKIAFPWRSELKKKGGGGGLPDAKRCLDQERGSEIKKTREPIEGEKREKEYARTQNIHSSYRKGEVRRERLDETRPINTN